MLFHIHTHTIQCNLRSSNSLNINRFVFLTTTTKKKKHHNTNTCMPLAFWLVPILYAVTINNSNEAKKRHNDTLKRVNAAFVISPFVCTLACAILFSFINLNLNSHFNVYSLERMNTVRKTWIQKHIADIIELTF